MVENKFSPEIADRIIDASDLASGGIYTATGTYDHSELLQLVTQLNSATGISVSDLVRTFGSYLFGQIAITYPQYFEGVNSTFDLLKNLDDYIHVEVKKLYPDAELPRFSFEQPNPDTLIMNYTSTRPFADFAEGMIRGCIEHFKENIEIQKKEDTSQGSGTGARFTIIKGGTAEAAREGTELYKKRLERERAARKAAELLLEEKSQELFHANKTTRDLLDNMDEGIFTLSSSGEINPGYSAATEALIGRPIDGLIYIDLFSDQPECQQAIKDTFEVLFSPSIAIPWEDLLQNIPSEIQPEPDRWLRARYRPLLDQSGNDVEQVMVIVQNITKEKELQEDIDRNRALHHMVVQIIQNRDSFDLFYKDALEQLAQDAHKIETLEQFKRGILDELFRTIHTIKGTSAVFGMNEASAKAHQIEDILRKLRERRDETFRPEEREALLNHMAGLKELIVEIRESFFAIIGEEGSETRFSIPESKIERIQKQVLEMVPPQAREAIKPVLVQLKHIPTGHLLRKYKTLVQDLGERLGKQVQFAVNDEEGIEIPAEFFNKLDPAFLHIIRNALDHGIEDRDQRIEAGKNPMATISVSMAYKDQGILFRIADDGRGIDTERIRALAVERGLVSSGEAAEMSSGQVLGFLFMPRFTTKDSVTDLSGRGVGLDVVSNQVKHLKGKMTLNTVRGKRTVFHLYYPLPGVR